MKKLFCAMLVFVLVALCGCFEKKSGQAADEKEKTPAADENLHDGRDEQQQDEQQQDGQQQGGQHGQDAEMSPQQVLESIGAYADESVVIDEIAASFMEAVKNADAETVSQYTLGSPEIYEFLKDSGITSYELIPFRFKDEERKEDVYYGDELNKYLCVVYSDGTSTAFAAEKCYYLLATTEYSFAGNSVYYFTEFSGVGDIFKSYYGNNDPYLILAENFVDSYGLTLDEGRTYASDIDFNSVTGFHFIPHMMFALEENNSYDAPHSLTQINRFISEVFNGNKGVELKTADDYSLWISADGETGSYSADDEIYGCYYGHGTYGMSRLVQQYKSDKRSVTVTVDGYADYSCFVKSRTYTFNFASHSDGVLPCLIGIEMISHIPQNPVGYEF